MNLGLGILSGHTDPAVGMLRVDRIISQKNASALSKINWRPLSLGRYAHGEGPRWGGLLLIQFLTWDVNHVLLSFVAWNLFEGLGAIRNIFGVKRSICWLFVPLERKVRGTR